MSEHRHAGTPLATLIGWLAVTRKKENSRSSLWLTSLCVALPPGMLFECAAAAAAAAAAAVSVALSQRRSSGCITTACLLTPKARRLRTSRCLKVGRCRSCCCCRRHSRDRHHGRCRRPCRRCHRRRRRRRPRRRPRPRRRCRRVGVVGITYACRITHHPGPAVHDGAVVLMPLPVPMTGV